MQQSKEHIVYYKVTNLISLNNDLIVKISCFKQSNVVVCIHLIKVAKRPMFIQLGAIRTYNGYPAETGVISR